MKYINDTFDALCDLPMADIDRRQGHVSLSFVLGKMELEYTRREVWRDGELKDGHVITRRTRLFVQRAQPQKVCNWWTTVLNKHATVLLCDLGMVKKGMTFDEIRTMDKVVENIMSSIRLFGI